jgi:hypothetical protein
MPYTPHNLISSLHIYPQRNARKAFTSLASTNIKLRIAGPQIEKA